MRALALLLLLAGLSLARAGDEPTVLVEFESAEPLDGWSTANLALAEVTVPEGATPTGGRALELIRSPETAKPGYLHRAVAVNDWRGFRALSFHAKLEAGAPAGMRIIASDDRRPRGVLKRFTLEPGEWREVVLPLSEWRPDNYDQAGDFARVDRVLIRWEKGSGSLTIDDFRLLSGDRAERSCRPTNEERLALAFPNGGGKALKGKHFVLLTDVKRLRGGSGKKLLGRLEDGLELIAKRYGVSGEIQDPVPVVIFAKEADYRRYFPRLGEHYGASVPEPRADGFTVLGVCGSSWDKKQGWDRPVYVHEAMHGAVGQLLGLMSNGNWIQEALANGVQARLYPKSVTKGAVERSTVPWDKLFAEPRPKMASYPQLMAIAEYLAERHKKALPDFWEAVRGSGEPVHESMPPALAKALGLPLEKIEKDCRAWCRKKFR